MSWDEEWRDAVHAMTELDHTASETEVRATYYGVIGDRTDAYDDINTRRAS